MVGLLMALRWWGSPDSLVSLVGVVCGWAIAFMTAHWNSQAALIDGAILKAHEQITERISASALAGSTLSAEISHASWVTVAPGIDLLDAKGWMELPRKWEAAWTVHHEAYLAFLTTWTRNQLLFSDLEELRLTLYDERLAVSNEFYSFLDYVREYSRLREVEPRRSERLAEFQVRCRTIASRIFDVVTYLSDFQGYMQNAAYKDLLGRELPARDAKPPHKTLKMLHAERLAKKLESGGKVA